MKVAVCDEQPEMLHILSDILSELPIVKKVELYSDMDMCLGDLDEGNYYDVVFMDVDWKQGKTGIDYGKAIYKITPYTKLIYIAADVEKYIESESSYGNEIIGAMMTKMTENANDFKMIFGMYSNKVEEFLKMNAGLKRRLRIVNFPDYTPDQLLEIFDRTLKEQGCTIIDEAHDRIALILQRKYEVRGDDFGNAGEVKKMFQDMKHLHLERVYTDDDPSIDRYCRCVFF